MSLHTPRAALRKIVIVNTADVGGGAEVMSMAMLEGLTGMGFDAWLLVGSRRTAHPRVIPFFGSPFFDYRPSSKSQTVLGWRRKIERRFGLESFAHPYSREILTLTGSAPDLVLCHNLHGGYFDLAALAPLARRVPVVLRLFDSWLFTGHCAVPRGCERWQTGCGHCPDLAAPPAIPRDATRFNWHRKRRLLGSDPVFYASGETEWILERARRSLLAPAVREWRLVRGGVDLQAFAPGSQQLARDTLGLDREHDIALVITNLGLQNPTKDYTTVRHAMEALAVQQRRRGLTLLVVGADGATERLGEHVTIRHFGYVADRSRIPLLLRASDVYLHSSIGETFGLAVAEALACGVPVICVSTGGVREIVEDGQTGWLVEPGNAIGLAGAIDRLLADPVHRSALGAAAAGYARRHLDRDEMVRRLAGWFAEIHARHPTANSVG